MMKEVARASIRFFSIAFVFFLLFASLQFASADGATTDYVQYVVKIDGQTVIEGTIVDNELGTPVGGAGVGGEVRSEIIYVNMRADENGRFRVVLPDNLSEGNHTYILNISAQGYDPRQLTGVVKKGEQKSLGRIKLVYNPFDIRLSESSSTLEFTSVPEHWGLNRRIRITASPRNGYSGSSSREFVKTTYSLSEALDYQRDGYEVVEETEPYPREFLIAVEIDERRQARTAGWITRYGDAQPQDVDPRYFNDWGYSYNRWGYDYAFRDGGAGGAWTKAEVINPDSRQWIYVAENEFPHAIGKLLYYRKTDAYWQGFWVRQRVGIGDVPGVIKHRTCWKIYQVSTASVKLVVVPGRYVDVGNTFWYWKDDPKPLPELPEGNYWEHYKDLKQGDRYQVMYFQHAWSPESRYLWATPEKGELRFDRGYEISLEGVGSRLVPAEQVKDHPVGSRFGWGQWLVTGIKPVLGSGNEVFGDSATLTLVPRNPRGWVSPQEAYSWYEYNWGPNVVRVYAFDNNGRLVKRLTYDLNIRYLDYTKGGTLTPGDSSSGSSGSSSGSSGSPVYISGTVLSLDPTSPNPSVNASILEFATVSATMLEQSGDGYICLSISNATTYNAGQFSLPLYLAKKPLKEMRWKAKLEVSAEYHESSSFEVSGTLNYNYSTSTPVVRVTKVEVTSVRGLVTDTNGSDVGWLYLTRIGGASVSVHNHSDTIYITKNASGQWVQASDGNAKAGVTAWDVGYFPYSLSLSAHPALSIYSMSSAFIDVTDGSLNQWQYAPLGTVNSAFDKTSILPGRWNMATNSLDTANVTLTAKPGALEPGGYLTGCAPPPQGGWYRAFVGAWVRGSIDSGFFATSELWHVKVKEMSQLS